MLGALYGTNAFQFRRIAHAGAHRLGRAALRVEYVLTGRGTPQFVPVLMYHSVGDTPPGVSELSVRADDFEAQMRYLSQNGFTPITFDELSAAEQYKKPVLITFDDGYVDNFTVAYPVLKKYGFHATVFMVSSYVGAPGFLSGDELRQMSDFVSIQSHTVRHEKLSGLSEDAVASELSRSRDALEALTGKPVTALSYPEGNYNSTVLKLVPKYYTYAVTTKYGYWRSGTDRYRICRLAIGRSMPLEHFENLLRMK